MQWTEMPFFQVLFHLANKCRESGAETQNLTGRRLSGGKNADFFLFICAVKEKEDLHPDVESQGMNDDTFCEYR